MERKEWIDGCRRLFTRLVRTTVWADFVFPTGGKSDRQLGMCFDGLCREVVSVSAERLSDFCICQTYAISGYDTAYRRKWNVSHSFGKKAIGRYLRSGKERRYREDRWLKSFGLSRHGLARAGWKTAAAIRSGVLFIRNTRRRPSGDCSPPKRDISSVRSPR